LQSKIAFDCEGRDWATDRPTFTDSESATCRSWKGCEFAQHVRVATAAAAIFSECRKVRQTFVKRPQHKPNLQFQPASCFAHFQRSTISQQHFLTTLSIDFHTSTFQQPTELAKVALSAMTKHVSCSYNATKNANSHPSETMTCNQALFMGT